MYDKTQVLAEIPNDSTSRNHLRNIYREHLKDHDTTDRLFLLMDAQVNSVEPGTHKNTRVIFTDVLLKTPDTSVLYDQIPARALLDHLNCFVKPEVKDFYNLQDQVGQRVVLYGFVSLYRRGDGSLEVGFEVSLPHRAFVSLLELPKALQLWKNHLVFQGLHDSQQFSTPARTLHKQAQALKENTFFSSTQTYGELQDQLERCNQEFLYIKSQIHQPLHEKYLHSRMINSLQDRSQELETKLAPLLSSTTPVVAS